MSPEGAGERGPAGQGRAPLWVFFGLWLAQGLVAATTPLLADEAYYVGWAQALALGYLDHPPGIAAWIALGGGHPRAVTWLLSGLGWWILADAARRAGQVGWRWLPAVALATPLGFSVALAVTPDAPALLAWSGVVWGVVAGRPGICGLALAAALWSKSTVLVALPGLLWALGPRRFAQVAGIAAVGYAPHVVWSWSHGGLPWSFQGGRAVGQGAPLGFLAGQVLALGPALAWAVWRGWRASGAGSVEQALARLSWPVLALWGAVSCLWRPELNWAALAWPAALVSVVGRPPARLVRLGLVWTAPLALAWWGVSRYAPLGVGPPRDGPRLVACLAQEAPAGPWVAGRYQEAALLALGQGTAPVYRRAVGGRPSELDRQGVDRGPGCGFWFLGDAAGLGGCPAAAGSRRACGLTLTWCPCAPDGPPAAAGDGPARDGSGRVTGGAGPHIIRAPATSSGGQR